METSHVFFREDCAGCGKCAEICSAKALELYGKEMQAEDVVKELGKDIAFYAATNGGITVSGGEPLFQSRFTEEILRLCKERGIHTALETCGYASESVFSEVLRYCDAVLFRAHL